MVKHLNFAIWKKDFSKILGLPEVNGGKKFLLVSDLAVLKLSWRSHEIEIILKLSIIRLRNYCSRLDGQLAGWAGNWANFSLEIDIEFKQFLATINYSIPFIIYFALFLSCPFSMCPTVVIYDSYRYVQCSQQQGVTLPSPNIWTKFPPKVS